MPNAQPYLVVVTIAPGQRGIIHYVAMARTEAEAAAIVARMLTPPAKVSEVVGVLARATIASRPLKPGSAQIL